MRYATAVFCFHLHRLLRFEYLAPLVFASQNKQVALDHMIPLAGPENRGHLLSSHR